MNKLNLLILKKAFEKHFKTIEDQGEKQVKDLTNLKGNEKNKYVLLMIIMINYYFQKKEKYLKISIKFYC